MKLILIHLILISILHILKNNTHFSYNKHEILWMSFLYVKTLIIFKTSTNFKEKKNRIKKKLIAKYMETIII